MTATTTIRQTIIDSISDRAAEYEHKSHELNYEKLHVYRDGELRWTESINASDDIIDSEAEGFAAIPSLATTGAGSCSCNCDYCNEVYSAKAEEYAIEQGRKYVRDEKYATHEDAINDAVANSDLSDIETMMLEALDEIPVGYFRDEQ